MDTEVLANIHFDCLNLPLSERGVKGNVQLRGTLQKGRALNLSGDVPRNKIFLMYGRQSPLITSSSPRALQNPVLMLSVSLHNTNPKTFTYTCKTFLCSNFQMQKTMRSLSLILFNDYRHTPKASFLRSWLSNTKRCQHPKLCRR